MGCNCKAKQKIRATKRYFDIDTQPKKRQHLTVWDIAKMCLLMVLTIAFLPIVILMIIFNGSKTIRLDNFLGKKKTNGK